MKICKTAPKLAVLLLLAPWAFTGCESTGDSGPSSGGVMYYGVGYSDPWYHGHYDYDYDVVVTPPPGRPTGGPRPSHPIARPPMGSARPMPSIPSAPRPAARPAGGRR